MRTLHDGRDRSEIVKRVAELRRDSERKWGKMSVEQMLWHVNGAMASALGQFEISPQKPPLPRPIMKLLVLYVPWGKGAPTMPDFVASGTYDFEGERGRCLQLIDTIAAKRLKSDWPVHPMLGRMSGQEVSRLHAKHLNHHLLQFGV